MPPVGNPGARAASLSVSKPVLQIMNKIEEYKKEKDGLDILGDIPRYAADGWETINDGDKERLKWAGVFFRRQTPGHFMMPMPGAIRSRMPILSRLFRAAAKSWRRRA
jgi:hypothetical protein